MYEVIGNLENKIILNEKTVLDLKSYIYNKYPGYSSKKLSLILADGIHKVINNSMTGFSEMQRVEIERSLIRDAVSKNDFSISGYKVFCQYVKLNMENEENIGILQQWLNSIQESPVTEDELTGFINTAKYYKKLPIEDAVKNAAESEIKEVNPSCLNKYKDPISQLCSSHIESIKTNAGTKPVMTGYMLIKFIKDLTHRAVNIFKAYGRKKVIITASVIILFCTALNAKAIGYAFINSFNTAKSQSSVGPLSPQDILTQSTDNENDNGLPQDLKYVEVDQELLRNWLNKKNSILADEPYFSSILYTSKEYNINPLFLIAITGQEQGFVPKSNANAIKIANNPFNVYGSWAEYNSNINDSSRIAAQTIINLSKDRPKEAHAIQWINGKYAEDKNWWVGVDKIFNQLKKEIIK